MNVDEPAQLITVETSLRMTWTDPRLNVTLPEDSPTEYIRFGDGVVKHIWFPDVYIDGIQDLRFPAYKVCNLSFLMFDLDLYNDYDGIYKRICFLTFLF